MNTNESKSQNLLALIFAAFCLLVITAPQAHAAKPKASQQAQKERLVLMPLRLGEEDQQLQGAMEMALVKGLQQKYEVFFGEQVAKKAREIFLKESRNTAKKECDETRCLQGIAESFQAELLATANITKQAGGYFIALSIQNLFDNKVVQSESVACKGCDAFQVVDKLKELSGAPAPVAPIPAAQTAEESQPKVNPNDPDAVLWAEVQKGNTADDYQVYIDTYPKGKYLPLAKARIKKLKEEAQAAAEQQEQQAWDAAQQGGSEDSYAQYLKGYPNGRFAGLAKVRLDKLKKYVATREEAAQWQTAQGSEDSKVIQSFLDKYPGSGHAAAAQQKLTAIKKAEADGPKAGAIIRDCPDCPEMVVIPAGSFDMGETGSTHQVTLKKFAMGKTEVTQGQWKAIMGYNPSEFKNCGDTCPVEQVSWNDAQEFIGKLNAKTGKQYRLPSEAEWEYACRAGVRQEYCGSDDINSVAWYGAYATPVGNSAKATNRVTTKQANTWGLYDMSGNVWEWVEDSWHDNYSGAPNDGSAWQGDGAKRVLRGGSWVNNPQDERAANRDRGGPANQYDDRFNGFRLARTLP